MTRTRWIVAGLGAAALLAGALVTTAPRMTLLNAGIRIEYPWPHAAAALACAAGAALLAAGLGPRWARILFGLAAALALLAAVDRFLYRLEAGADALVSRGLLGGATVPWGEITRVQNGPAVIVVWGRAETQIRVDTSRFRPDQRAALERTLARRVAESTAEPAARR